MYYSIICMITVKLPNYIAFVHILTISVALVSMYKWCFNEIIINIIINLWVHLYHVVDSVSGTVKYRTVQIGESVTLDTGVTDMQKYDKLLWKFEDNYTLISKIDGTDPVFSIHERFKDRILYHENGSLTIKDTRFEHAGLYRLEISRSGNTILKRFSVSVSGDTGE